MYSRTEAQNLKQEFWVTFGKAFPRKWILYDTKIKNFQFKFDADTSQAEVSLVLSMKDRDKQMVFANFISEKSSEFDYLLATFHLDTHHITEYGKEWVKLKSEKLEVSIYNKNSWREIFEFFIKEMEKLETFFLLFEDEFLALDSQV